MEEDHQNLYIIRLKYRYKKKAIAKERCQLEKGRKLR